MAKSKSEQNKDANKINKKTFNKKKWREEKYSNKHQFKRWEEKRKSILQRNLKKQLASEGIQMEPRNNSNDTKKCSLVKEAMLQCDHKAEQKRKQAQLASELREKRLAKIKEYKSMKLDRARKLNQKTRKGQPLMRGKLELLQEKIQKMVTNGTL